LNDRALSVLEIDAGQPKVVAPAPRTLGPAG